MKHKFQRENPIQFKALLDILAERERQDAKWGVQNHDPEWWLAILMQEVGELSQAILECHFDNGPNGVHIMEPASIRHEAVQVAAVAEALIECLDRKTAKKPK